MPRYIAFFGSINVGGNRLTMADLRHAFEREEFEQVETVVASGNVLFAFPERPSEGLEEKLGLMLRDRFDITTFAAVRTRDELSAAIAGNPFASDGDEARVHTLFLDGPLDAAGFARLQADHAGRGRERIAAGDRALHIDYVDGAGNSRLTNDFIARRIGRRGTARNLRSLRRILERMERD